MKKYIFTIALVAIVTILTVSCTKDNATSLEANYPIGTSWQKLTPYATQPWPGFDDPTLIGVNVGYDFEAGEYVLTSSHTLPCLLKLKAYFEESGSAAFFTMKAGIRETRYAFPEFPDDGINHSVKFSRLTQVKNDDKPFIDENGNEIYFVFMVEYNGIEKGSGEPAE